MNLEEIFESSNKPSENLKVATNDDDKMRKYSDFIDIASGKKKFEGEIDTPQKMEKVLNAIEKLLSNDDDSEITHSLKKGISRIAKQIPEIRKILAKIKVREKISPADEKKYDAFADAVEDIFFSETYVKELAPQGTGGTSKKNQLKILSNSFPVKFTLNGKTYFGLLRSPSGMITWSGDNARNAAREANIPTKIPLVGNKGTVNKSKMIDNLKKDIAFKYIETDAARKKVSELLIKYGNVDINQGSVAIETAMTKALSGAIEKVGFWKDLEEIL